MKLKIILIECKNNFLFLQILIMENKIQKKEIIYCDEKFIETTYMGISIIKDSNGYYQASKICKDNKKKFKDWKRLERTTEILEKYSKRLEISTEYPGGESSPRPMRCLLYKRSGKYHQFQGWYIHSKLLNELCTWCDIDYAIKVNEIIDMYNEELHLRNITLEDKMKEMNDNLEKLRLENQLLKKRTVPEEESIRYLYILRTKTGFRLSGDSNTKFSNKSIYAKYQFSASMNYRKCFNNLCDNQYYHFNRYNLNEITERIESYDPIILIKPNN